MAAAEQQVLDFLYKASDRGFSAVSKRVSDTLGEIEEKLEEIAEKTEKKGGIIGSVFGRAPITALTGITRALGATGAALSSFDVVVGDIITTAIQFHGEMINFRRETGMNTMELNTFSSALIDTSQRYGVELDRVANIARFVTTGSDAAKKKVGELSGAVAFMSKNMGVSTQTAGSLTKLITTEWRKAFELGGHSVIQGQHALGEVAEQGNMTKESLIGSLLSSKRAFNEFSDETKLRTLPTFLAMTAAANKTTGRFDDMVGVMEAVSDDGRNIGRMFLSMGKDVNRVFAEVFRNASSLDKQSQTFQNYASKIGLSTEQLETLIEAYREHMGIVGTYAEAITMSDEAIQQALRNQQTGLERLGERWQSMKSTAVKAMKDLAVAHEDTLTIMMKGAEGALKTAPSAFGPGESLGAKIKGVGQGAAVLGGFLTGGIHETIARRAKPEKIDSAELFELTKAAMQTNRSFIRMHKAGLTDAELRRWVNQQSFDPRIRHMMEGGPIPKEWLKAQQDQAALQRRQAEASEALLEETRKQGQKGKGTVDPSTPGISSGLSGRESVQRSALGTGL